MVLSGPNTVLISTCSWGRVDILEHDHSALAEHLPGWSRTCGSSSAANVTPVTRAPNERSSLRGRTWMDDMASSS